MNVPLEGVRVLDLTRLLPGPFCTLHLAQLGAEILKVESPSRPDYLRFLEPYHEGQNVGFVNLNRGKKSVVIDFERDEGREVLARLAGSCDVLVESFRSGYLRSLALGPDDLSDKLIYCSLTAYGQSSSRAGHDLNCLALTGLTDLLKGDEEPAVPAIQLADITCGMAAAQAILAALFARERSGKGRHLDIAMVDAAYHLAMLSSASAKVGVGEFHAGLLDGSHPAYRYYRCSDAGYLAVGAVEEKFQGKVLAALELESWEQLGPLLATRPLAHWVELLEPLDACVEPVLTPEQALSAKWMQERHGCWQQPPGLLQASFPVEPSACAAPGEHTLEVLQQLGIESQHLSELADAGVLGVAD